VTIDVTFEVIIEHFVTPSLMVNSRVEPLKKLFASMPLTPLQRDVGQEIIFIFSTPHALKVFATPITTFVETRVES
jgi:hypothetical protein